ncbi:polycomb group protein ASXL1-like isoform 1-T2 [Discoglossus pictus]
MTPKQILNVIEAEGLKDVSGSSPLACLNAMLHSNSRTREALFYKLPGRISLFTMKKNALQWSNRVVCLPEMTATEDEKSNQWNEDSAETPVSADDTSCSASCSTDLPGRETRSLVQIRKRRSAILLPRVVLTPLKVNGAHLPSTSGLSGHHSEGQNSSNRALGSSFSFHRRASLRRDTCHLKSVGSPLPGQTKRNKGEEIDFETPGSILVNTNLRALINLRTFNAFPSDLQQQLLLLLPEVDRQVSPDGQTRISGSALNNEFFAHSCQRWRERLADGEFTPEMQFRLRQEMEKEKKVEGWKEMFFEDFYGQKLGLTEELASDQDKVHVKSAAESVECGAQRKILETYPKDVPVLELRSRTRRGLYKNEEKEESPKPAPSESSEVRATTSISPAEPEPAVPESKMPVRDTSTSTSDRVPELHPETPDQKRKSCETETSSPSLEKKPRMEQRQSFRNTIRSVHTEKPQPTKEEPKVPPIRIQLSRIKPPWLDKGLSSYQICPWIIPDTDTIRCRTACHRPAACHNGTHHPRDITRQRYGIPDKFRNRARDHSRSKSAKRNPGKQTANSSRTQLLPSAAVRNQDNLTDPVTSDKDSYADGEKDSCISETSIPNGKEQVSGNDVSVSSASTEIPMNERIHNLFTNDYVKPSTLVGCISHTAEPAEVLAAMAPCKGTQGHLQSSQIPLVGSQLEMSTDCSSPTESSATVKTDRCDNECGQKEIHLGEETESNTICQEKPVLGPDHTMSIEESFGETQWKMTNSQAAEMADESVYTASLSMAHAASEPPSEQNSNPPTSDTNFDPCIPPRVIHKQIPLCVQSTLITSVSDDGRDVNVSVVIEETAVGAPASVPADKSPTDSVRPALESNRDEEHLLFNTLQFVGSFTKFPELDVEAKLPIEFSSINTKKFIFGRHSKLSLDARSRSCTLCVQLFAEQISVHCSCSLQAMAMCKGCGAFCHDDCIGPPMRFGLCLVIR